jgi:hypothetical protein
VDPRKIPRVLQVRSGWAVLTADITTRDLLVQRQTERATDLGAAAIETRQEWFIYLVSDYPCKLTDLYGNEADSDAAVDEEVEIQTRQKPVNIRPVRHQPDNPLLTIGIDPSSTNIQISVSSHRSTSTRRIHTV